MRLCTIIILYHPDKETLLKSLPVFNTDTEAIIVWRNSFISDECQKIINNFNKIIIAGDCKNVGIATAINQSIIIAEKNGYSHILTMDQDSYFDEGMLQKYKTKIVENESDNIGVYGINPLQSGKSLYPVSSEILDVSDTITSGSVFKISNFSKTNCFRDDLFIDAVDYEYCYRIKKLNNLKTIVFSDVLLNHVVGYIQKTKFGFSINNYSPFRTYFIIRNQLKIWKMYPTLFSTQYKITFLKDHLIFRIIKIIIAENEKAIKLKAIFIGFFHFLVGRSGFYDVNSKSK
ncbi:glycosyltransferase [Chryseobacterium sp. PBS4-4]|uniref:Glycosyltransferase n=1 Tax=Chryseobacterium edaphi TaxID=2976532 RepID=A0ABT2W9M7_9FLAO|nr:glycosyltransferase [Chryseobacterium edaphi]MCU7618683.1 glycosyltransferase [Chryseobacterium edaphi]